MPEFSVNPPAPASYASGLMDFSAVGKLGDEYLKGRMANAFPNGIPYKDGSPDYNAILNTIAKTGGAQSVAAIMPYIYYAGLVQPGGTNTIADKIRGVSGGGGGGGEAPPTEAPAPRAEAGPLHPAGTRPDDIRAAQRQEPPQTSKIITGTGSEFEPFVIPEDEGAIKIFAQQQNFPNGSHFKIGNTGWGGVKGETNPNGTQKLVNLDTGKTMSAAKQRLAERFKRGDEFNTLERPPAPETPSGQRPVATPQVVPRPGEQGIGIGGAAVPRSGVLPQGAAPVVQPPQQAAPAAGAVEQPPSPEQAAARTPSGRPPLPTIDPVSNNPQINALKAQQRELLAAAADAGQRQSPIKADPRVQAQIEQANHAANAIQKDIDTKSAELYKSVEEINKYRRMGFASPIAGKAWEEAQGEQVKAGIKVNDAIQGAANQVTADLMQDIELGQRTLDSPGFFSGFGAHQYLDFQKAKAALGGDPKTAAKMEAFEKTSSKLALGLTNMERFMAAMGGQQGMRTFASQIHLVAASSPRLEHTVAGNRVLYETAKRSGERMQVIQRMANKFLESNPYLNSTFQQQVSDYLQKNPLLKPEEANDPDGPEKFLGAPQLPKGLKGPALEKWISDMKFTEGNDLVRKPEGVRKPGESDYVHVLKLKVPVKTYGPNPPGTQ